MSKFADIGLRAPILRAVEEGGYETMTPIQSKAIPLVLEGKDLIGVAQTGTGKTAAFSLPIIQLLLKGEGKRTSKATRSLILAPTRELAIQIGENIRAYAKYLHLKAMLIYGGASEKPQIKSMLPGVDILIATPGRLLDLVERRHINLGKVEFLVLDEADRMLDMGFIRDIKKIMAHIPKKRQTVLFSATMPKSVETLANNISHKPSRIEIAPAATTAEKVTQHVLMVPKGRKRDLLAHILKDDAIKRVVVFTRTKHGANKVAKNLEQLNITAGAIHGNKSQNARQKALKEFRAGDIRVLVATDVAARGIDIDGVTHVINYEIPNEPESYVHRIGRTARAGAAGISMSFCDHSERGYWRDIEKIIRQKVPVMENHPYHAEGIDMRFAPDEEEKPARRRGGPRRSGRNTSDINNTSGASKPKSGAKHGSKSKPNAGPGTGAKGKPNHKPNKPRTSQRKARPNNRRSS